MKNNQRSYTADGAAAFRAAGYYEKMENLKNPDYMSRYFISTSLHLMISISIIRKLLLGIYEKKFPGLYHYHTARTKHFDSLFMDAANSDTSQIVILGAGLDTRAYRFEKYITKKLIYEIDHPNSSQYKQKKVSKYFKCMPKNVQYLSLDFTIENLSEEFDKLKINKKCKTLFLLEGITMYLPLSSFQEIIKFVDFFPSGSLIAFDYFYSDIFTNPDKYIESCVHFDLVAKRKEPYIKGFTPNEIENLLSQSLELSKNIIPDELIKTYLGNSKKFKFIDFAAIAHIIKK